MREPRKSYRTPLLRVDLVTGSAGSLRFEARVRHLGNLTGTKTSPMRYRVFIV